MKKIIILLTILLISPLYSNSIDSIRLKLLEEKTERINNNQINYSIEKDLIRETYKINYDRINLIITLIIGLTAVLGFLGLKSINDLKEKYKNELDELKNLKLKFELKSNELDKQKTELDTELKEIVKTNNEQNKKLKLIELKELVTKKLLKENNVTIALEYANEYLKEKPEDVEILTTKGRILSRLNRISEGIQFYKKAYSLDSNNWTTSFNLIEIYLFNKQLIEAKELISIKNDLFSHRERTNHLFYFQILINYVENDTPKLTETCRKIISSNEFDVNQKHNFLWDFSEAYIFIYNENESQAKQLISLLVYFISDKINIEDFQKEFNEIEKADS